MTMKVMHEIQVAILNNVYSRKSCILKEFCSLCYRPQAYPLTQGHYLTIQTLYQDFQKIKNLADIGKKGKEI